MHPSVVTITLLLGLFLGTKSEGNDTTLEEAHLVIVQTVNDFSTAFYKAVSSEPGNIAVAPFSVATMMTLVWLGSTEDTADELERGLHLPKNREHVEYGFKYHLLNLESTEAITLHIANKLYLQEGYRPNASFRHIAENSFRTDAEEVNFLKGPAKATLSINSWVEEKTEHKIKHLVYQGNLTADTRMLALNAVYFRGAWLKPFNETETSSDTFYTSPGTSIQVPMMRQTEYFYHGDSPELEAQILKLYYRSSKYKELYVDFPMSMLLFIPDDVAGLPALEAKIDSFNVNKISNFLSSKEISLSLPKFKVEFSLSLVNSLEKLGMSSVFREGADLSGITDELIYLNDFIHKAVIEVTERGTDAATDTYIQVVNYIGSSPMEVNVNRPFLFMVMDERSNAVLFMGRVEKPDVSE